jgi:uncharacterized protein YaaN involved in tellurite resistance
MKEYKMPNEQNEQKKDVIDITDAITNKDSDTNSIEVDTDKEEVDTLTVSQEERVNEQKEEISKEEISNESAEVIKEKEENIKEEAQKNEDENSKNEQNISKEDDEILPIEKELKNDGIELHQDLDEARQAKVEILAQEIKDRQSIIFFGSKAQEAINRVSESMLQGVKSKDLGYAGDSLNSLVTTLKGFDIDELDPTKKQGFFSKLFGFASPVQRFLSKYDEVRVQIDKIVDDLEEKKSKLLTDITALERLYKANFEFIKDLDQYIAAGVYKLKELNKELKELEKEAKGSTKLEKKLGVRDKRALVTALEARVHDLKLSRVVALQSLPSIRLIQDNNKTLVEKINSTLVNTLPLWKNQLAQAVTIFRSKKASESIKAANDFTNELLEENAKKLKEATKEITEQANRGVFDIESIKKANQTLIDSINESLDITFKAKEARAKAEVELEQIEKQLQDALVAAERRKIKV